MQLGQIVYIVRKLDNIVIEQYNRPYNEETEYLGYSFQEPSLKHESGAFKYSYTNDLVERDYSNDSEYKEWNFKNNLLPLLKEDFINAYGSYGSLGSLIADAKSRFLDTEKDTIDVFCDEFRQSENIVDFNNCSNNVDYSNQEITQGEKGCYYVDDVNYDAIIVTKEIPKSFTKYYVCLISTILEAGYDFDDIELRYKKGSGNWMLATPLGKFPYSIFAKIEDSREGNIYLKVTLKTGNATKNASLISFAIVGI